ncbi:hypothetical protein BDP27DRAFT_1383016 [Rhodocollybia butyracea]|uniref:(4-O-methyl)-D-glucuronate--lignin esterase n=1 Tax=Rhodocollybia butyracea TaxID=206335 RepID=A0A9P5PPR8_9AGAR|nr:hypothetical protein BDP27DRAFT_1383016 [Rhodocollybia butyracea]
MKLLGKSLGVVVALAVRCAIAGPASCDTPATLPGFNNAALPDPFLFNDGTPVLTKDDWTCRRQQLGALIQGYEAGFLPPAPETLTGTFSLSGHTGNLTVFAANDGKSISGSIPIPAGIAVLNYANSAIAQQNTASSRGIGTFFQLYGSNATASAMTAWVNPAALINTQRIGVTGCSRDGKGALMAGAFEERIALTIPQESGSGNSGSLVQTATEIVMENVWFSVNFENFVNTLNVLPYDHHSLMAMVAPRGLVAYENTDFIWLSPVSAFGDSVGARTVFQALGVEDNLGFEQIGGHEHCVWPANLTASLDAFIDRFLLGQNVSTEGFFATNNVFNGVSFNSSLWLNFTVPTLT